MVQNVRPIPVEAHYEHMQPRGGGLHIESILFFLFFFFYCCKQNGLTYYENKGGVSRIVALPFTLIKKYLKAKEELRKLKYFTMQK